MKHTPAGKVLTDLVLEIFRLNGRLLGAGDELTRSFGQTSSRWQVMGAVEDEPRTVAEIARLMGLTRQSVQRTADLLGAEKLGEFVDNPNHRRAHLFRLTDRGVRLLQRIGERQIEWANSSAEGISSSRLTQTLETLVELRARLE